MSSSLQTRSFDSLEIDQQLPALSIEITPKLIVGSAIATRDFQNVHHDKAGAQALGSPDIFMNILASNGLVGRFVGDWAGANAILKSVKIRLGAPNYPGDTMVLSGHVTALDPARRQVEIAVVGSNSIGNHVTGQVTVVLP